MTTLADYLTEAQPGFACGKEDAAGMFQFRMNNVTREGRLDLGKRRRVPLDAHKKMERFLVRPGDVLFNATNSPDGVGKSVLVPALSERAVFSNHFLRIRPRPERLSGAYLARWLHWNFQRGVFQGMCRQWVNQATVSRDALLDMPFEPPALDEQRRIAAILDQADALRAKRREALALLDDLTQSIFTDMFGQSIRERVSLKSLSTVITKGTTPTSVGLKFTACGVPFLRVQNLVDGSITHADGDLFIDVHAHDALRRSKIRPGDVLTSIAGTIGRTSVVPDNSAEMNCNQAVAIVRLRDDRLRRWMQVWLSSHDAQSQIRASAVTATISNLSLSQLGALQVPLPEVNEVETFNSRVTGVEEVRTLACRADAGTQSTFATLQARAFSGRL